MMNQRVNYRGKLVKDPKQWAYGQAFPTREEVKGIDAALHSEDCIHFVDPKTLTLNTGFLDLEGEPIFFGDVVEIFGYGLLVVHEFSDLVELYEALPERDIGKIQGNIFDDPSLREHL